MAGECAMTAFLKVTELVSSVTDGCGSPVGWASKPNINVVSHLMRWGSLRSPPTYKPIAFDEVRQIRLWSGAAARRWPEPIAYCRAGCPEGQWNQQQQHQAAGKPNMTERVNGVPAERMPPLIEAAGLPPAAATRTVYRLLGHNPSVLNVVAAQIQTLIRKNSLPHRLRELIIMLPLEDGVMAWPPDGVRPANAEN
jgi:hypothetical protein